MPLFCPRPFRQLEELADPRADQYPSCLLDLIPSNLHYVESGSALFNVLFVHSPHVYGLEGAGSKLWAWVIGYIVIVKDFEISACSLLDEVLN